MQISADLHKLEQHENYIQQELRTSEILLDLLQEQYQIFVGVSEEQAALYRRHIQFVQEWQNRTRRRGKLLADVHDTLSEAKQIMSDNTSDARRMLQKLP